MSKRTFTKKRVVIAVAVVAVLAVAGSALAYFTNSGGSATSQATVGSSSPYSVTYGTISGTMLPGQGSTALPFTVTNTGTGRQSVSSIVATVNADANGNITSAGAPVTGCLATWFVPTVTGVTPGLPTNLAGGGTITGTANVSLTDTGSSQDPCQGAKPDVIVTAK